MLKQVPAKIAIGENLTSEDIYHAATQQKVADFSPSVQKTIEDSEQKLNQCIERGQLIYGVNTGFGPLAKYQMSSDQSNQLQKNLVFHLSSGVGQPYSAEQVRAIMLVRLNNLSKGYSGVSFKTLALLKNMLDQDILPFIPQMGTVGASGDLTPLAHLALAMMGQGHVLSRDPNNDAPVPADQALIEAGLAPLVPEKKDALALVNGTAAMTAVAALNAHHADNIYHLQTLLSVMDIVSSKAPKEAYHPIFAEVRPHKGMIHAFNNLAALLGVDGSASLGQKASNSYQQQETAHQAVYSLRCVGQELGAFYDCLDHHQTTVDVEINSVSDNPLVDKASGEVYHGGNFYGQHIAYASDFLGIGLIKMGVFMDRVVARLCDPSKNKMFPEYLSDQTIGIHSGFMGAQVTVSSLVAELRSLSTPASIQSVPTNNDNQDVVTMGTIAARKTAQIIDLVYYIISIEALMMAQIVDLQQNIEDLPLPCQRLYQLVRSVTPKLQEDRPLSYEIEALTKVLKQEAIASFLDK